MTKRIITINRMYGSNGRKVGKALAAELGIQYYDKELIRIASEKEGIPYEELQKVEIKEKQVMELVNQFFTLAQLEAGDTDIKITKVNISESCRENVLGFYEILIQKEFEVDILIPEQD